MQRHLGFNKWILISIVLVIVFGQKLFFNALQLRNKTEKIVALGRLLLALHF